jgi:arginyl-tRNA synthetase
MYPAFEAILDRALDAAIARGDLPVQSRSDARSDGCPACRLEPPADPVFGDATSRIAMLIARRVGRPAAEVATTLVSHVVDARGWLARVEAAGPGFVNVEASLVFWRAALAARLDGAPAPTPPRGRAIVLRTPPADETVAARADLVADALARMLRTTGHVVERATGSPASLATGTAAETARVVVVHDARERGAARQAKDAFGSAGGRPGRLTAIAVERVELCRRGRPAGDAGAAAVLAEPSARFALLGTPASVPVVLDVDGFATGRIDDPWAGARYALARIARVAGDAGGGTPALDALGEPERECLRGIGMQPDVVALAARRLEVDALVAHVRALASAFHRYYNRGRFADGDAPAARARRALARGIGHAIDGTLALVGLSAARCG